MILTLKHGLKAGVATVIHDGVTERYDCFVSACRNPVCTCRNVNLELKPTPAENDDHRLPVSRIVNIDLENKRLCDVKGQAPSAEDLLFAKSFLAALDKADFDLLDKMHLIIKIDSSEKAAPDSIDADFDYDEIEQNGTMWLYNDALPFGKQLLCTLNDRQCILLDQFCLLPKCPCTDAYLIIMTVDSEGKPKKELGSVTVNYNSREWQKLDKWSFPLSIANVKTAIEEQIPDIYKELFKRHSRLKAIYAHCKKRHLAAEKEQLPLQPPKVGRNEPCPCGSGKKYKKCCMGK
jgi:hypothetical protein